MCGRFALSLAADELAEAVRGYAPDLTGFDDSNLRNEPEGSEHSSSQPAAHYEHGYRTGNYNVAPRSRVPVLRQTEQYEGQLNKPALESMVGSFSKLQLLNNTLTLQIGMGVDTALHETEA